MSGLSRKLDTLIVGGSGFVSGTLARTALECGHNVWIVTRGEKPLPQGVRPVTVDRKNDAAFQDAIAGCRQDWDLVVDCIGYQPEDARQDIRAFSGRAGHFVFISTDFVFDPAKRAFPQPFDNGHFLADGYGGLKRQCELELLAHAGDDLPWTVFRPCHIYGPGSQLGCLPQEGRKADLIQRIRAGETLRLIGGGHFLQQPVFARDLAELILSACGCDLARNRIFCSAGPDILESVRYYEIIGEVLGCRISVEELPVDRSLQEQPELAPFLCHRIYDLSPLRLAGLKVPATPIADGLAAHVESLL
ncbi:MAG: NAD-dependent epimerase/dehydratase family protein [Armatimonadetes bacterium]|nr:NAD-dependent epimerase/dehydratase family protein [Armatimonadota bacterium]